MKLKQFGNHPLDKYLIVEFSGKQILARQSSGNDYFETFLGRILKSEDMSGWIDEASTEDIEQNIALMDFILALQSNHDDETVH